MGSIQQWSNGAKKIRLFVEVIVEILMAIVLIWVTYHFLTSSITQLNTVQNGILQNNEFTLPAPIALEEEATTNDKLTLSELQYLVSLEARVQENRYRQASLSLMTRIWISYLGFVTGMILALVGASFILGKLKIDESTTNIQISDLRANLKTTSPGLLMAALGVILIVTTIRTHHPIEVKDPAVYFHRLDTTANDALNVINTPAPDLRE